MNLLGGIRGLVHRFMGDGGTFGNPGRWLSWEDLDPDSQSFVHNPESALRIATFYACVRVLGTTLGTLPIHYYRRKATLQKERIPGHPLEVRLNYKPNPELFAPEFWLMAIAHLYVYGNAYVFRQSSLTGAPLGFWIQHPATIQISRNGDRGELNYWKTGRPDPFSQNEIIHLRLFTLDGNYGINPIAFHRQSLGLAFSAEAFGAQFFRNSARPSGVLEVPQELDDPGYERLKKDWAATYGGTANTGKPVILEQGTKWHNISLAPNEAQFLETRKMGGREICRICGVPPHMVQDLENATFTNIEHQGIDFVRHTIRPLAVLIEKAFTYSLGLLEENAFLEFELDGLLRGDQKSRFDSYSSALQNGWMNRNEVRSLENLSEIPDGVGEMFTVQLNMVDLAQLSAPPQPEPEPPVEDLEETQEPAKEDDGEDSGSDLEETPTPPEENATRGLRWPIWAEVRRGEKSGMEFRSSKTRLRLRTQWKPVLKQAGDRVAKREAQDLAKIVKKTLGGGRSVAEFSTAVSEFYSKFFETAKAMMGPAVAGYIEAVAAEAKDQIKTDLDLKDSDLQKFTSSYLESVVSRWVGSHRGQILTLAKEAGDEKAVDVLNQRLAEWEEKNGDKFAEREAVQAEGASARWAWALVGVSFIVWRSSGDACPLCDEMDGQIVGAQKSFLEAGDRLGSGENSMTVETSTSNPPIHRGCTCYIEPA